MRSARNEFNEAFYERPPANARYGYRWKPGQGVPEKLDLYDSGPDSTVAPGLYVTFTGEMLDPGSDHFGRKTGKRPVYPAPADVSAALRKLVESVARLPPKGEEAHWQKPDDYRLRDVAGFLSYVARCLDFINQTASGRRLLDDLAAGAARRTFVTAGSANSTFGFKSDGATALTRDLHDYVQGKPVPRTVPKATLRAAVQAAYGGIDRQAYDQLAAALNSAPLYTLFDTADNFQPNYLQSTFRYLGRPLTGATLHAWISPVGDDVFDAALRGMQDFGADGVMPLRFFALALGITLLPYAKAGAGVDAMVQFDVKEFGDNYRLEADFRPPAIGLAHELVHAWHYTRGLAPGYDFGSYDTTAAELKFTGIGPYRGEALSENAVRDQWSKVKRLDPSNTWPQPVQRLVYDPLGPGESFGDRRPLYGVI